MYIASVDRRFASGCITAWKAALFWAHVGTKDPWNPVRERGVSLKLKEGAGIEFSAGPEADAYARYLSEYPYLTPKSPSKVVTTYILDRDHDHDDASFANILHSHSGSGQSRRIGLIDPCVIMCVFVCILISPRFL